MTPQQQHNHHNRGRRRRKWSPRASQDALRPTPTHHIDRGRSPEQADMFFVGIEGPTPHKTLRCCGGASPLEQRSILRGIHRINPTPKHIRLLGGLSPINPMCRRVRLARELDSRGQFPPAAIMVRLVVVCRCGPGPVLTGTLAYNISLESSCK